MLRLTVFLLVASSLMFGAPCATAPLIGYLNGGDPYSCTLNDGDLRVTFNHDLLPSYVGLDILPLNNGSANPSNINVTPGDTSLTFTSDTFVRSTLTLSSQAELVHFLLESTVSPITSTTFRLLDVEVARGGFGVGTGLAIGQELVCVGGSFTSLPVGLVTSVTNGLLGTGSYGCNGVALIGTAALSAGPLDVITNTLALPNLTGVTDTAYIQLPELNNKVVDVIKIQALVATLGGRAATSGFGNDFTLGEGPAPVPEPASAGLLGFGGGVLALAALRKRGSFGTRSVWSKLLRMPATQCAAGDERS